jgi:hypothetical protein
MKSITSTAALKEAILQLENRQKTQKETLHEIFLTARESLMPANLFKTILGSVFRSPKLISGILLAGAGFATTFFLKKKYSKTKSSIINKMFEAILPIVTKVFF